MHRRRECQKSIYSFFRSFVRFLYKSRAEKATSPIEEVDEPKSPIDPAPVPETKKRPRLDVSEVAGGRDRKRGKTMFGILVGTLNKAKIEDKERSASEAVSKDPCYMRWRLSHWIFRPKNDS